MHLQVKYRGYSASPVREVRHEEVFHFDAPREKYHCDAAILWCFDNRLELGFRKFLKRIGVINSDFGSVL